MVNDKKNHIWRGKAKEKDNGEQSDLCDLEQVTLKPQLQAHHCLTTWLQILYHSLLWGDSIRKGTDLEKHNCLFGVHPAVMGKLTTPTPNCTIWHRELNYKGFFFQLNIQYWATLKGPPSNFFRHCETFSKIF